MSEPNWTRPDVELPPDWVEVLTMDSTGRVQTLVHGHNLWWFPDRSMYVYYVPRVWRLPDATSHADLPKPPEGL